jgi:XTP/dITP diphosphohydrolase
MNKKYKDLVVATRNQKKKQEIIRLLGHLDNIKIWSLSNFLNIPPIEEDGLSFDANAIKKATIVAKETGMFSLADDSGLEVEALGGEPGVYSSRYAGIDANDEMNNRKLLEVLKGVPLAKRNARYMCSIALAEPDGKVKVVRGECYGIIATSPAGNAGFGYDPLFIIPRFSKTVAQLGPKIKDKISHRAKAILKARRIILRHSQI